MRQPSTVAALSALIAAWPRSSSRSPTAAQRRRSLRRNARTIRNPPPGDTAGEGGEAAGVDHARPHSPLPPKSRRRPPKPQHAPRSSVSGAPRRDEPTYRLEGQGGNITLAVGTDGLIMVDTQFAPLSDKIKAAIKAISPLPVKYAILTHFHGDHTGGVANFQRDGVVALAQDNIRLRLIGGTTNATTGNKMAPQSGDAIPKETYVGGQKVIEVGGRKAILTHYYNAHTDGDTGVFFPDANVICTGDIMNNNHSYQQVDYGNGGDIRGMIRATNDWLKMANDQTKVQTGHGPLANKKSIEDYNAMVKAARERIEKLVREGKTEAEVLALDPLKDLTTTWGTANPQAGVNMTKQVYHSFSRS